MAQRHPSAWPLDPMSCLLPGQQRELDVVEALVHDLPQDWQVFHGIPWQNDVNGFLQLGEWDVVVVSPAGHLAILEIKAGEIDWTPKGLVKCYAGTGRKNISSQCRLQHQAMIQKLRKAGIDAYVAHALVLPDASVPANAETAHYPRSRIVDAVAMPHLGTLHGEWLRSTPIDPQRVAKVSAFLRDELRLAIDPRAFAGALRSTTIALQAGLASTLTRLELPAGSALCIQAVAGSGKTLLARQWLEQARRRGTRWGYMCFNRMLADALRASIPEAAADIATFHERAISALRRQRKTTEHLDFTDSRTFDAAVTALAQDRDWAQGLDGLILDESADLKPEWFAALRRSVSPDTRWLVLLDADQRVHPHTLGTAPWWETELPQAIRFSARENFRSPRALVETLNLLELTGEPLLSHHPFAGEPPEFEVYPDDDPAALLRATETVLERWFADGIAPQDVAVLSFQGRGHNAILAQDTLAGCRVRRFTGQFDAQGAPQWSEGELLVDTVLRFKGLSARAVLLTETDWAQFDESARRRLYVALTRAEWRAAVVLSERAARDVKAQLEKES